MASQQFSTWRKWSDKDKYEGIQYPGIYVIAISTSDISGQEFKYLDQIVYVGMTNSVAGLKGRLKQFDNTISQTHWQHGGADRLLYENQNYERLVKKLYVSTAHWECNPKNPKASDLLLMGEVAKAEYETLAKCLRHRPCRQIPKYNDKKNSPKYSKK
ncbi:hypothetical protein QM298_15095 [Pseudomonas mendocina]|nr:hypothetical protein [Pseudomonas mendocina]MDV5862200.1 hypothetical protein [Pseudomonas mendocina]